MGCRAIQQYPGVSRLLTTSAAEISYATREAAAQYTIATTFTKTVAVYSNRSLLYSGIPVSNSTFNLFIEDGHDAFEVSPHHHALETAFILLPHSALLDNTDSRCGFSVHLDFFCGKRFAKI